MANGLYCRAGSLLTDLSLQPVSISHFSVEEVGGVVGYMVFRI